MFRIFNRYWSKSVALCVAVEMCLLSVATWIAFQIRFYGDPDQLVLDWDLILRFGTFTSVFLLTIYLNGAYDFSVRQTHWVRAILFLRSFTFSALALWVIYYISPTLFMGRGVLALSFLLAAVFLTGWRVLFAWVMRTTHFHDRILIVGSDESSRRLAKEILDREHLGYRVVGFLSDDEDLQGVSLVNPSVIGSTKEISRIALAEGATRVVVAQEDNRGKLSLDELLRCKTQGIPVERGADLRERLIGCVDLNGIQVRSWLVFSPGYVVSQTALFLKRIADIVASFAGLVVAAPVMLLTAVAIKAESKGPVFYRQQRVGRNGQVFTLWKFRSMRVDAETEHGAQWAKRNDPRVTRVGRFIRRSRLDELPQLWNVFVGDMSLVGPRPERPEFVEKLKELSPLYEQRLVVRPGLTGWAQIRVPYAASFEQSLEKLEFDLYYIKNLSLFLDMSIMASTIRAVILGRGVE